MSKSILMVISVSGLIVAGVAAAQTGMLLDYAADQMVQKFQKSTCAELKAKKNTPQTDKEKAAAEFLRNDAQARAGTRPWSARGALALRRRPPRGGARNVCEPQPERSERRAGLVQPRQHRARRG